MDIGFLNMLLLLFLLGGVKVHYCLSNENLHCATYSLLVKFSSIKFKNEYFYGKA